MGSLADGGQTAGYPVIGEQSPTDQGRIASLEPACHLFKRLYFSIHGQNNRSGTRTKRILWPKGDLHLKLDKQGIKWRQVIAVAMIAVPWFLRDELASRMDQHAADAQQVLTEKDEQQEQQQQISDQRDLLRRIGQVQAQLRLVDAKIGSKVSEEELAEETRKSDDEFLGNFFKEAGADLGDTADKFGELMQRVKLPAAEEDQFGVVAEAARKTAHDLESFDPNASESVIDAQFDALSKTQDGLVDAYEKLSKAAEQERDRSTKNAKIAREVAWGFTAFGAVLLGSWKKLLGGSDEEEEEGGKK